MEKKLEITAKLEALFEKGELESKIAILNLPAANFCEKRAEFVEIEGKLQQSCLGCVTHGLRGQRRLSIDEIYGIIDFFAERYGIKFITINGRGDPFHPSLKEETLQKIIFAHKKGIQSYVFTAGNNLDENTCNILAENETNVMISLFGNRFIDESFFFDKKYSSANKPLQNQADIAANLRRILSAYEFSCFQPQEGTTRIGMNYVVSEKDLFDRENKISKLKKAANNKGIFVICNTSFEEHFNPKIQEKLEQLSKKYSNFHLRHSTAVNDQCQMGAGSSATVDFDGMLLRCPYIPNKKGDGLIKTIFVEERERILDLYINDRSYSCVMRKHQK